MKRAYIINGVESRNEHVQNYYKQVGVYDYFGPVEFVNTYKPDDLIVHWIHEVFAPYCSYNTIAGLLNFTTCMEKGLASGDDHFTIIQDDVVFPCNWQNIFDQIKPGFFECPCIGVNYHISPNLNGIKRVETGNIGGCECIIVSKEFAKFFLVNIDFRQGSDIVISGILKHHKKPLEIIPICQQTSVLNTRISKLDHQGTKYELDWKEFVKVYTPTGLHFDEIKTQYDRFVNMKKKVEDDFEITFGTRVDITNVQYVYMRHQHSFSSVQSHAQ